MSENLESLGNVEQQESISKRISKTVAEFKNKWPDVEVLQNGPDIIIIGVKGPRMTREIEDQIYYEILGALEEHGLKCEVDNGAPGGWSGDSYGEATYEQANSWKVTKIDHSSSKEPNKTAQELFEECNDNDLLEWWWQYGQGEQAAYYRGVPRSTAQNEIKKRGLTEVAHKMEKERRAYGVQQMGGHKGWAEWRMIRSSESPKKPNLPE